MLKQLILDVALQDALVVQELTVYMPQGTVNKIAATWSKITFYSGVIKGMILLLFCSQLAENLRVPFQVGKACSKCASELYFCTWEGLCICK